MILTGAKLEMISRHFYGDSWPTILLLAGLPTFRRLVE
jgi:hypothetical protein